MDEIIDFNIYNYSIHEMEKLCELKEKYIFSDISSHASKTKNYVITNFKISPIKILEIDVFFQNICGRLERNLINKKLNEIINNQTEFKKLIKNLEITKS